MSVNFFDRDKLGKADELTTVASSTNRVYVGTQANVDDAIAKGQIGEASVVYVTDDYEEQVFKAALVPVGTILPYMGSIAPQGYMLCNGDIFDSKDYPDLFAILGNNILPDLRGRFLQGRLDKEELGKTKEAGIPNLEGGFGSGMYYAEKNNGTDGKLFYTDNKQYNAKEYSVNNNGGKFFFNANRYNSIYGNSDTVQPPAITINYIIRAL